MAATTPCVVYRFYDCDDVPLYIGMTEDLPSRIERHREREWWPMVVRQEVSDPMPRAAAARAEQAAITSERPIFNTAQNSTARARRVAYLQHRAEPMADDSHFLRVPVAWVKQVGLEAAAVHGLITWRAERDGEWTATRATLEAETGLSTHRLRSALEVLREVGWLSSRRASREDATRVWQPLHWPSSQVTDSGANSPSRDGAMAQVPELGHPSTSSLETVETSSPYPQEDLFGSVVGPRAPVEPGEDVLAGFDEWWALYPRKQAKADGRKAWAQVTRHTSPDVIQAGLVRQRETLTDAHSRGFCPLPASWLRGERWADEQQGNVTPIRPDLGAAYDPEYAQTLPPPRTDPFAAGSW